MPQLPSSGIKALVILHGAMLAGQLIFTGIASYLNFSGTLILPGLGEKENYILIGVVAFGLLMTGLSFTIYKKKLAALKDSAASAAEKSSAYRTACIIRWAMLEAPVLVALIAFMLTGNYNFLIIAVVIILLFISTRPTKTKAAAELSLREDELV